MYWLLELLNRVVSIKSDGKMIDKLERTGKEAIVPK
jgi:hypothetical protein